MHPANRKLFTCNIFLKFQLSLLPVNVWQELPQPSKLNLLSHLTKRPCSLGLDKYSGSPTAANKQVPFSEQRVKNIQSPTLQGRWMGGRVFIRSCMPSG